MFGSPYFAGGYFASAYWPGTLPVHVVVITIVDTAVFAIAKNSGS